MNGNLKMLDKMKVWDRVDVDALKLSIVIFIKVIPKILIRFVIIRQQMGLQTVAKFHILDTMSTSSFIYRVSSELGDHGSAHRSAF